MGEKIKTIATICLKESIIEFELNEPLSINGEKQIHIQTDRYRLEFDETTFFKLASTVLVAKKNLTTLKKLDD